MTTCDIILEMFRKAWRLGNVDAEFSYDEIINYIQTNYPNHSNDWSVRNTVSKTVRRHEPGDQDEGDWHMPRIFTRIKKDGKTYVKHLRSKRNSKWNKWTDNFKIGVYDPKIHDKIKHVLIPNSNGFSNPFPLTDCLIFEDNFNTKYIQKGSRKITEEDWFIYESNGRYKIGKSKNIEKMVKSGDLDKTELNFLAIGPSDPDFYTYEELKNSLSGPSVNGQSKILKNEKEVETFVDTYKKELAEVISLLEQNKLSIKGSQGINENFNEFFKYK